jgi:integrase
MAPERGYATHNPTRDVILRKGKNPDGFRPWAELDVALYEERHRLGTKGRLAIGRLLYTGVRRSDVVRFGAQMERDGLLCFTERKGRRRSVKSHELPILPPLRASLDAAVRAGLGGHLVYLATPKGAPHSEKAFGGWFKRRCAEAGLAPDLSAHGLRKLAAIRCAEAGATESELMAIFGWTNPKLAAFYTRQANRKKMEAGAIHKLLPPESGTDPDGNKPGTDPGKMGANLRVVQNFAPIRSKND